MTALDLGDYLNIMVEYAKAFYQKALITSDGDQQKTFLEISFLLGFSFLEGTLSYIFEHFDRNENFNVFERSILEEKDVKIEKGIPKTFGTKYRSIEERIQFLLCHFSANQFDFDKSWWQGLMQSIQKRNNILHPKNSSPVLLKDSELFLNSLVEAVDEIYKTVFGTKWPKSKLGVQTSVVLP